MGDITEAFQKFTHHFPPWGLVVFTGMYYGHSHGTSGPRETEGQDNTH